MCGIIGCAGESETLDVLLTGLEGLEYRGYDSAGVALSNGDLSVCKREGEIQRLQQAVTSDLDGRVGIGHTRWSTHGPPSDANAHPHTDCTGEVAVVHNGIVENYADLRAELREDGHEFDSDTDSEVVPHLIEANLAEGATFEEAFRAAVARLEGSYALAAVSADSEAILATRRDSPLVVGVGDDAAYLASDVPAFLDYTDRVVYLEDGEFARLESGSWTVSDAEGHLLEKSVSRVEWDAEETAKSGYDHYMLKEIHEQPRALRKCLRGRVDELTGSVDVEALKGLDPESVQFVACGTSYHAALYGAQALREAGVHAQAFLASEYATSPAPVGDDTLVVGITQSGETADTLSALREAERRNVETLAMTNVVGSTAARECDRTLFIRAGPEIGVAATKTFSSQVVACNLLAAALTERHDAREIVEALRDLPSQVQTILDDSRAAQVADRFVDSSGYFFVGRGYHHAVALEGALKLKEISYKHAEGFPAGELKHGPLALVTDETPVFALVTGNGGKATKTVGNVKEVEARDAPVVAVTDGASDVGRYADAVLEIPETHPRVAPVLANVQLQLVAYYIAKQLGRSIDKPRNLAKSVTVE
ncbi:glutamine--fructose-6-phosphate transaminase (isomerizing) [Halorussus gelatinilyticus]|uniref:Glutamine--fructose-6-phosphate aminotransferase [isomerizing] n=1 Tax=Halorussus gelatinilyticus TaxID=2937524 RepID=A0A8U0IMQ5_9EURY|nr:glutamine--fructose-6-phosphate transaminase (isomerizing) [Halorussus gelatinilyticus]UPW01299.1 glutamine--fructose-6-phosphate transaminase (isomerizing) [Halorussus gelatinilyticus]